MNIIKCTRRQKLFQTNEDENLRGTNENINQTLNKKEDRKV
jgi:hypothetical protein